MTNFTQKQIEEMLQEFLTDNFYVNISEVVRTTAINKRIKAAPKLAKQLLDVMTKLQAAKDALSFMLKNTPDEMFCDGALMTREQFKSYIKARFPL